MKRLLQSTLAGALLCCASHALAFRPFTINHIAFQGLQRVSSATVLSYMPIHVGQRFTEADSVPLIEALYKTGFFTNVVLYRRHNTLVVRLTERPIIGLIRITGNKKISTKKLTPVLKKFDIVEGAVYNPAQLKEITQGLEQEYERLGYHNVAVTTHITREPRNRVAVYVHVIEGPVATVSQIVIEGNHAFSEHELLHQFKLTKTNLLSWFTHDNRYSEAQLDMDLNSLANFYLDHGYLRFRILSHHVTISPDHRHVTITIHIQEGDVYHISGYRVVGPDAHRPEIQHTLAQHVHVGDVFSRGHLLAVNKLIANYFADRGYAFPNIDPVPTINDKRLTAFITYHVSLGDRIYVRHIYFAGNHRTEDVVLRERMQQLEDSLYSRKDINESKRKLANLPYFRNVHAVPMRVPGHPDQVDLTYHVDEVSAGRAMIQGGYSDVEGFLYGASVTEPNFLGTGRYVSLGFTRSGYNDSYSFSYNNPYYTVDGISRGFSVYYNNTTAKQKYNFDPYDMSDVGGNINYGIPTSVYDTLNVAFGYDYIHISNVNGLNSTTGGTMPVPNPASPLTLQFVSVYPHPFNSFNATVGWTHATLDRAIFPTSGSMFSINVTSGVPIITNSVGFVKATFTGRYYIPLGGGFILEPHTHLGYGRGLGAGRRSALPFYNNFYAGGIDTLPGYEPNSLGPKNPNNNFGALGGNVEILGGISLIFPNFISDRLRTSVFVAAGNIFQTDRLQYTDLGPPVPPGVKPIAYEDVSLSNMRASVGLMVSWYSPLGLINVSVADALVRKLNDQTQLIGFSFGTSV